MKTFAAKSEQTELAALPSAPAALADKGAVAAMANMSRRWVDGEMAKGMPHLKFGARRCRFDLDEVRAWLRERYGTRRRGPAKALDNTAKSRPAKHEATT